MTMFISEGRGRFHHPWSPIGSRTTSARPPSATFNNTCTFVMTKKASTKTKRSSSGTPARRRVRKGLVHQVGERSIMDETDMHAAGESLKQFIQSNYLKRVTVSWNAQRWGSKARHTVRGRYSHCRSRYNIRSHRQHVLLTYLFRFYRRVFSRIQSVRREGRDCALQRRPSEHQAQGIGAERSPGASHGRTRSSRREEGI